MSKANNNFRYEGDPQALREWQKRMGYTYDDAAAALGMSRSGYSSLIAKSNPVFIDLRTALACAAIELGLEPLPGNLVPYQRGTKWPPN
jgi:transcriptional regulator with XRE-family HTH domain